MKWREISEDEVKNAITQPEKVEDSIKDRKNAFKHINNKWLKVTFKKESDITVVITAMDKNS